MATSLETESVGLVVHEPTDPTRSIAAFASQGNFDAAQRMAKALASSSIVPKEYQGNVANCLVAMEIAGRTGAGIMMVMQNLYVIQGRPSWSAVFLIGSVNACGRFSPLRYEIIGDDPGKMDYRVRAYAKDLATGDVLSGEWITWAMVNGEKWLDKPGSKWKTMPGQMFRYRAASFWTRTYAPEISLGMLTADESEDIPPARGAQSSGAESLNRAIAGKELTDKLIASGEAPAAISLVDTDEDILAQDRATAAKS